VAPPSAPLAPWEWPAALAAAAMRLRAALLAPTPPMQGARFATLLLGVALIVLAVGRAPTARSRRGRALLLGVALAALGLLALARA
jgi:hypothetical protein